MFFDMANNGYAQHTAWAGAGNGVLVYDPSGGPVTQANQVELHALGPRGQDRHAGAAACVRHEPRRRAEFERFLLEQFPHPRHQRRRHADARNPGAGGCDLDQSDANSYKQAFTDGSSIDGETTFTRTNGTTGTAATVTFANDGGAYVMQQSVTHNGDGSTTLTTAPMPRTARWWRRSPPTRARMGSTRPP